MRQLTVEELKMELNKNLSDAIVIELDGLINTKINIQNIKIKEDADNLIVFDNEEIKVKFNKHQIMKIEEENGVIFIKFDSMQNVIIKNRS